MIGLKLHARSHHGARFEKRIMPPFELPPIGLSTCHARRRLAAADAVEHHYFQEASPSPGPCYSPSSCRKSLKKKVMLKKSLPYFTGYFSVKFGVIPCFFPEKFGGTVRNFDINILGLAFKTIQGVCFTQFHWGLNFVYLLAWLATLKLYM